MTDDYYPFIFRWDVAGRKGQRCRVWARSKPSRGLLPGVTPIAVAKRWNSVGIEFPDGFKMVTSGNSIRRAPQKDGAA